MTRTERVRKSPKGLINNREIKGASWKKAGLKLDPIGPGKWATKKDSRESIKEKIVFWRQWATGIIKLENDALIKKFGAISAAAMIANPADFHRLAERDQQDRVCLAAQLLKQLDKVVRNLNRLEKKPRAPWAAIDEAILLASCVHQLTIVENEVGIAQRIPQDLKLSEINDERRDRHVRWRNEADRIQNNRGRLKLFNNTELATQVKKTLGVPQKVGAIRKAIAKK